ncbi:RebB family R body protein [Agrilutibacter solisilvae]|uniref:RebB family R body protein n=1 Tax=Agrilutibacter solisilvae TaxID=2763317 RepID=A0A975ARQ4_9GAMM|nr:RebB family R body protein [Lysobacter solisilvae]QSX77902.1 RebB family R body protein [Lysobacter solisilvae]
MADESTVNSQITDAVTQVNETIAGASGSQARALADQVMAHAVGLAMQNAVAQQQQAYILRNAVTTAAARAILQSSPEEALRFAREVLSSDDVAQTLERLGEVMSGVQARQPSKGG